jgi:5-methylcytosine-specific restriction enzyme A
VGDDGWQSAIEFLTKAERRRRVRGSWRSSPLPRDWPKIRKRILARDPVCSICGLWASTTVDHIGRPDDHRDEVLRGLCGPCHRKRSSRQAHIARDRKRRREPRPHPGIIQ